MWDSLLLRLTLESIILQIHFYSRQNQERHSHSLTPGAWSKGQNSHWRRLEGHGDHTDKLKFIEFSKMAKYEVNTLKSIAFFLRQSMLGMKCQIRSPDAVS